MVVIRKSEAVTKNMELPNRTACCKGLQQLCVLLGGAYKAVGLPIGCKHNGPIH